MKKLFIGVLILALLFVAYLGVAFALHRIDRGSVSNQIGYNTVSAPGSLDQNLVGDWDTGCLVPDPNSPWAERHTFTIKSDGTGHHTRYSGNSCATLASDLNDNVNFTSTGQEKINLSYMSGVAVGVTIYDIYQVAGNTLEFGHGFCNCVGNGKLGNSEGDRYTALNDFLLYKKQ